MSGSSSAGRWTRIPIARIEDLRDAVYGAGLEATQMSAGRLSGTMAFAERDGIMWSSALIGGRVALSGTLSHHMVTLGLGVRLLPGSRQWLNEVDTGNMGVFLPRDDHDAHYAPGSIYATVSLTADRLEEEASKDEMVLDRRVLGGSGVHVRKLDSDILASFQASFGRMHTTNGTDREDDLGDILLAAFIKHLARPPYHSVGRTQIDHHTRIVALARTYIYEHLSEPITVDEVAAAAHTSRRTLFRAFLDVLDDTPRNYVLRLRLHRVRRDLANDAERARTIALISNQWGMSDLGRMAARYRWLFGERPSETPSLARRSI